MEDPASVAAPSPPPSRPVIAPIREPEVVDDDDEHSVDVVEQTLKEVDVTRDILRGAVGDDDIVEGDGVGIEKMISMKEDTLMMGTPAELSVATLSAVDGDEQNPADKKINSNISTN